MTEPVTDGHSDWLSAGQHLRQARESAGLHVVMLAANLKVPVAKLEALESGRLDELPNTTFARALALSVCRQLKMDPAQLLALLPKADPVRLDEVASLETPFKSADDDDSAISKVTVLPSVPRSVLWFACGVLLLAAVAWWAIPTRVESLVENSVNQVTSSVEGALNTVPDTGVAENLSDPAQEAVSGDVMSNDSGGAATPAAAQTPDQVGAGATGVTAAASPATASSTSTATAAQALAATAASAAQVAAVGQTASVLRVSASGTSWVEVMGASGAQLLQRELAAGESVMFSQDAPFKVAIGRANVTQVFVRGQAFDLTSKTNGNGVARFEAQ